MSSTRLLLKVVFSNTFKPLMFYTFHGHNAGNYFLRLCLLYVVYCILFLKVWTLLANRQY